MAHVRPKPRIAALAGLLGIAACGGIVRFHAIGAKSLWLDETATLGYVVQPPGDLLRDVATFDTHPPLYYAALHVWMAGSRSAARARAFSATLGVATLLTFYALAALLLPRAQALVATALLATSAYQAYFAQEARHYVLATFLVTLSWYFVVRLLVARPRRRWPLFLALAAANAAGLYTFYYTAFAIAAQFVVLFVLRSGKGRKLVAPWCLWQLVPGGLFAFYLPIVKERLDTLLRVVPTGFYALKLSDLPATAAQFASGFLAELVPRHASGIRAGGCVFALVALAGGLAALRHRRCAAVVALVWLLGPLVAVAVFPFKGHIYEPKHIIFAAPALALLAGLGLTVLRGKVKAAALMVLVVVVGANAVSLWLCSDPRTEKENWRGAFGRLAQLAQPGDTLILNPRGLDPAYGYYYKPREGRDYPSLNVLRAPLIGRPSKAWKDGLGRRVWLLEATNNVAKPNQEVTRFLARHPSRAVWGPTQGFPVGTITLSLRDLRGPRNGPGPSPRAGRPRAKQGTSRTGRGTATVALRAARQLAPGL